MKTVFAATLALIASAAFAQIQVSGTSDLWLAGAADGTLASGNDLAPFQSPVLVSGITGNTVYSFSATGAVGNGPYTSQFAPDGGGIIGHDAGAQNGISNIYAPINSLIGVFLTNAVPTTPAATLNFATLGLSFTSLAPTLNQAFFIGDGLTDLGQEQLFLAPTGATRLFLGTVDGYEWNNNTGAFEVDVIARSGAVPEPSTYGILAGALLVGAAALRRRRARA